MGCVHQHHSDSSESFFLVRGGYSRVNLDMDMSVSMEHGTGYHGTGTREATVINNRLGGALKAHRAVIK